MLKAEKRLQCILQKYNHSGFTHSDYSKLDIAQKLSKKSKYRYFSIGLLLIIFIFIYEVLTPNESPCLLEMPLDASKWFREPEICDICIGVTEVPKISNISAFDMTANFLNPSKPVVISDGAKKWPASKSFNFEFFKTLYEQASDSSCQFFPYKTEFRSLREVFQMDPRRAHLEEGTQKWYVGWSNCNDEVGQILRQHYDVPYFLPNTSENIALNWIFMGGPGQGAHMHVDNVQFPSWQAQITGKKLWRLAPPPECYYQCQEIEIVVEPVVVDTNRWYHQTEILAGDISITIGSEFD